jgi:quercetin dioxygenase-like cupin family protein
MPARTALRLDPDTAAVLSRAMALIIGPHDGMQLPGVFDVVVKVRGEDTAGVLAVIEETLPPHTLVPSHVHANDVWVHVLSGRIGVLVGDEEGVAEPGGWALKPRDITHAMWNAGDEPARIMEVLTPAGTERWFEEIAAGVDDFGAICRRHGIRFFPDSPYDTILRKRYGLT